MEGRSYEGEELWKEEAYVIAYQSISNLLVPTGIE